MKSNVRCVALVWLLAVPARGQTPAVIDCETNAACVALYEQAAQQSKSGQLVEAEKSYKLAYEVSHDARILFNIARVLDKRGQAADAMSYYRQFLQAPLQDETQKSKAREYLAQLEANRPSQEPSKNDPAARIPSASAGERMAPMTTLPASQTSDQQTTPIYKKGWFWGVMVGSVAAVGLGVGLGVGLNNRTPTVPSGTNTIAF
jgi:tetratricopeptide (TPR) repeat protein